MLVLSRRVGEQVQIGPDITVRVLRSHGNIRLGIDAPCHVNVCNHRLAPLPITPSRDTEPAAQDERGV